MTFHCDSCNRDLSYDEFSLLLIRKWDKSEPVLRYCKKCRSPRAMIPDVFWDGKPEVNLADDPLTGKPREFISKGHKDSYLKEHGLREAGDRYHGAPFQSQQPPKVDTRHEVKKALHMVKQMGRDRRRSEYQRIVKEAQNARKA